MPEKALQAMEALKQLYGTDARIYLANDAELAARNLAELRPMKGAEDLAAYVPAETFGVTDHGALERIRQVVNANGLEMLDGLNASTKANTVIVAGHKDAILHSYLDELGANEKLRGKFLILLSCYSKGDVAFNSHLIRDHGAVGVQFIMDDIKPQAVTDVVSQLGQVVGKSVQTLEILFGRAVDRAAQAASQRRLREEIQKLFRNIIQISDLRNSPRASVCRELAESLV